MKDSSKTKQEFIEEISILKQKIKKLEKSEATHKQAEEALKESELRNRAIVAALPDLLFQIAADGHFLACQASNQEPLLFSPDQVIGKQVAEILPPDLAHLTMRKVRETLDSGQLQIFEYSLIVKDQERYYEARMTGIGDSSVLALVREITLRKRAEEALRESEKRFRNIYEDAILGVYQATPEGRFISANPAFARMAGYDSPEELIDTIKDIGLQFYVHSEDRQKFKEIITANGTIEGFGSEYYKKDRSIFWIRVNARAVKDEQGRIIYYEGIAEDITDRKQAEQELNLFKDLVEYSSDAIGMSTPDGRHYYQNEAFNRLFGDIGNNPIETVYVDKAMGRQVFDTIMGGGNWQGEVKMFKKDRTILDIFQRAYAIKNKNGRIIGLVGLHTDITEHKRAEDALRESEERYRTLVKNTSEAIYVAQDGMLKFINRAGVEIAGYSEQEIISKPFIEFIHPDDRAMVGERYLKRLKGEGYESRYAFRFIAKNGDIKWLELGAAVIDFEGRPATLNVVTDITDRKRAEEVLKESEERYRGIIENILDIYYRSDREGRLIMVSPSGKALLGYDLVDEIVGKSISDTFYFDPEERDRMLSILREKGSVRDFDVILKHKDGTPIPGSTTSRYYYDERGEILGIEGVFRDITERRRAEQVLRDSESKYHFLAESMANVVFTLDINLLTTYVSPSIERMLGYTPEERIAQKVDQQLTLKSQKLVFDALVAELDREKEKGADSDRSQTLELEYYHKDGSIKHLVTYIRGIRDGEGNLTGFYGSNHDITDRKRAVEALRESEEWHRAILQTTMDGFWLADMQGHLLEVNKSYCRMSGYSKEELLTMSASDLEAAETDAETAAHMQKVMTLGEDRFETWHHRKDGSVFEVEISVQYKPSQKGQFIAFLRDITDRKQAEQALRESETNYRSVIENIQDVFYRSDDQGNLIMASPSYVALLGYESIDDCLGKSIAEVAYYDPEKRTELLRELQGKGSVTNYEVVLKRRDGTPVTVETNSHFYLDDSGNIAGIEGTFRDMTERKQAADEKRRLEERLQHADKMDAIGTLAGGIAHDFNNLLMGIQGYASLSLMNLDPSHPNYERLKRIEDQVQSGADLTRQLLGFARGGRYDVKPADMSDIIEKSSSLFGRTKKEISIHRKYGKDLWAAEVDRGQMEQVFMNLYVNAWQAMPGGGDIYLDTENIILDDERAAPYAVNPGRYIKISITDTGAGMDEKTRERIFDPFFTTKEMGRGTGLGLATVYGIIKGHKGMINVYSEPGHGTTFTIYLPASEKEVVKEKTETATIARGTETILIVDDEKMVLEVSKTMLESMGYRVFAAGSGQEAIAVYLEKQKEIDLVILDMIMPGMSGGETFDRLREINPGIKALLSSGYSINGQAQEILDRGCNGFLQKPFQLSKFSSKVRETID